VETIESLVKAFWQDKARGLLVGQACAEALAAPFLGRITVSNQEFAARSDEATSGGSGADAFRYGAGTALTLALAEHAATLGPDLGVDADILATSLAHMWWTSQDRVGYGIDDQRQFQAHLSGQEAATAPTDDQSRPRIGVSAAVPVGVLAVTTSNLSRLSAAARACAAAMSSDPVEQAGAALHACALAMALGNDPHRAMNADRMLSRLREVAHPELAHPLSLVRQLKPDATPSAAAQALGTGERGALDTVPVALLTFLRFPNDAVACVRFAAKVGGQTTTTAALAGALVGARVGESGLPPGWVQRIDRVQQLRESAERLTDSHTFQLA
jgi:ADP-ribosylglycohydrolase